MEREREREKNVLSALLDHDGCDEDNQNVLKERKKERKKGIVNGHELM